MTCQLLLLVTTLAFIMTSCDAVQTDATRLPGAKGAAVVEAVVDLIKATCVFPEDRLFLRRMAYVETRDGMDPNTYTTGNNGGIWRISASQLSTTTSCPAVIRSTCNAILSELGIDWTHVTWADLRKPLYSGLAATLYLMVRENTDSPRMPSSLNSQELKWSQIYHGEHPARDFSTYAANVTNFHCEEPMDIVFIMDSSGSITSHDYTLGLQFIVQVVDALEVPSVARVAVITFSDSASVPINFNSYADKTQLEAGIRSISQAGGATYTDQALSLARTSVFTTAYGARRNAKRVVVLVTDGQSNDPVATAQQAERLRTESGVVIFSIGVGGYDIKELHDIASEPQCSHTITLPDYNSIQSIVYDIERSTCLAPIYLRHNQTTTITTEVTRFTYVGPGLVVTVDCGRADVFLSYTNPKPNSANNALKVTADRTHPAVLTTSASNQLRPAFVTVVGTMTPMDYEVHNCRHFQAHIRPTQEAHIKCLVDGTCRECTDDMIRENSRVQSLMSCRNNIHYDYNPCSAEGMAAGHVMFAYPYNSNMFIRCNYKGEPFLSLCPNRMTFNRYTLTCGFDSIGNSGRTMLPTTYTPNPCTPEHIRAQYFYFEYRDDIHKFIHCDLWGNAWLEQCPSLQKWSQKDLVCVSELPQHVATTPDPHAFHNPCTPEAIAAGRMYHPYPCDHTRYIHCNINGDYWVQYCPGGMFYDPSIFICVVGDPQDNHGCD